MKLVKLLTPFLSSLTCADVSRTCALGGRTRFSSRISFGVETPCLAWTRIRSTLPTRFSSPCAVAVSKTAIVAPPIETPGSLTIPAIRKCRTGPRLSTPIVSPTL